MKTRKIISIMLTILFLIGTPIIVPSKAYAIVTTCESVGDYDYTYDPDAAIAFAKSHCSTDASHHSSTGGEGECDKGWLCAEFVYNCLTAGGYKRKTNNNIRVPYTLGLELLSNGAEKISCKKRAGTAVYMSDFSSSLTKGDAIIILYTNNPTGNTGEGHAVIYSGDTDSNGKIKVYAHNSRKQNEVLVTSSSTCSLYALHLPSEVIEDIGTNFYGCIVNPSTGYRLTNSDNNVTIRSAQNSATQIWRFERQSDLSYRIHSIVNNTYLDAQDVKYDDGNNVQTYIDHETDAQKWYFCKKGYNQYSIRTVLGNAMIDLHTHSGIVDDGANVQLYHPTGASEQIYSIQIINDVSKYLAADIGTDFYAYITNTDSGLKLTNNDNNVTVNSSNNNSNQIWKFERQSDNSYLIRSAFNDMCLDVEMGKCDDATNLQIYEDNGTDAQRWYMHQSSTNQYSINSSLGNAAVDIHTNAGAIENGANVQLYHTTGAYEQRYTIQKISNVNQIIAADLGTNFYAYITNPSTGYKLTNANGNVTVNSSNNAPQQIWKFEKQSDNRYLVRSVWDNKCLDAQGGKYADNTNVQVYQDNGQTPQRWYFCQKPNSTYTIKTALGDTVVDAHTNGGEIDNGANIQLYHPNGTAAQLYKVDKTGTKAISNCTITVNPTSYTYDGTAKQPSVTVKDGSTTLTSGTHYRVSYSENTNAGTGTVTITGIGYYTGSITRNFTLNSKSISNCTVTLNQTSYTYDGTAKQPTVTVKDGGTTLTNGIHYTVEYSNNVNAGTATVTVKGKGNYKDSISKNFTITANKYTIVYNANGGAGTTSSCTIEAGGTLTIATCDFTRDGYQFGGYNVARSSDNKWYVSGEGWKYLYEINDGGYMKKVYKPDETYAFNDYWYSGVPDGTIYTFYPIWLPNSPKLHCYLNYSGCNYMLGSDLGENCFNYIGSRDTNIYTLSVDKAERFNNQNSLKISAASAGASGKDMEFATSTNDGRCMGSYGTFNEVGDSDNFTLNFWAKGTVDGAKMYFRWGYVYSFQSIELTKSWKRYSVSMPKNINCGRYIHPYIDQAGTFWVNNITLTIGDEGAPRNFHHETECEPIEQSYTRGGKYDPLPEPVREGYTFLGWYTQPEGGAQITTETAVATYNTAVYAHWQKNVTDDPVKVLEKNGKLYELYDNNVTWEQAKAFCENKGGHLVTINSAEENELLASMIADRCCTIWLGAKLNTSTNNWEWITGEDFSFTNWASGEPSGDFNGFYAQMISFDTGTANTVGRWNDQADSEDIRSFYSRENCLFVCEYDILVGDANGDGQVNVRDVTAIQRQVAEFEFLTRASLKAADVDGNGVVDINDATYLQSYLAEFDVALGKKI